MKLPYDECRIKLEIPLSLETKERFQESVAKESIKGNWVFPLPRPAAQDEP